MESSRDSTKVRATFLGLASALLAICILPIYSTLPLVLVSNNEEVEYRQLAADTLEIIMSNIYLIAGHIVSSLHEDSLRTGYRMLAIVTAEAISFAVSYSTTFVCLVLMLRYLRRCSGVIS